MKRMRGMGGFAKALSKLKTRNPLEELIAELGYSMRMGTKSSESVLCIEAPIKRA